MKMTVNLESKDVRQMLAKFLGLKLEDVIPLRYGFAIAGMTPEEIEAKMKG